MSHLGGHANVCNVDAGLLRWISGVTGGGSFLDVGCGAGTMVRMAEDMGEFRTCLGVEGDRAIPKSTASVMIHDFAAPIPRGSPADEEWDVAYSCEFLEHVDERWMTDNVMPLFRRARMVVMTAAPPNWGGYHHVNERDHEYWIGVFNRHGMKHCPELSREARKASTMNAHRPKKRFVKHRALVFVPMEGGEPVEPYAEEEIPELHARLPARGNKRARVCKSFLPLVARVL